MKPTPSTSKPRILVAPLDWGLGHATRCIPVIYALLKEGCSVFLAGEGNVKYLLSKEFPDLPFLPLKNYGIRYSATRRGMPLTLILQIPKILSIIQYENKILHKLVEDYEINGVISDNRYGLYHPNLPSVFMTHQLLIKTPLGPPGDVLLQKLNYRHINRFNECWVPDEAENGLGGDLSHPRHLPSIPVHYLGTLSRFHREGNSSGKHLLLILSGPEPQRSRLEEIFLKGLETYKLPAILVRGLPGEKELPVTPHHIRVFNHVPSAELDTMMREASYVISRCGYSTVMDLARLGKRSILIPTPGQTEQEYLGRHLSAQNFTLVIPQLKFQLHPALILAKDFNYKLPDSAGNEKLENIVRDWLSRITNLKMHDRS